MGRVFKRGGKQNRKGNYLIRHQLAGEVGADGRIIKPGKWVTFSAKTTDKEAAEALDNKLQTEAMMRSRGIVDPSIEKFAQNEKAGLLAHLEDFKRDLASRGSVRKHVEQTYRQARKVIEAAHATKISEMMPSAVRRAIAELRQAGRKSTKKKAAVIPFGPPPPPAPTRPLSLATCNHMLRAVKSFTRWLRENHRASTDVLDGIASQNAQTDPRHERREASAVELDALVKITEKRDLAAGMTGKDRAILYRVAIWTGFRAAELRSLTRESFDLQADPPTVTVAAAYSKRRDTDVQPIRPDMAAILSPWLANKPAGVPVFARMPKMTARTLKWDLKAAGIDYRDASGHVLDFHALRHSYISIIVRSGVSVKMAQELARHSTPTLTIGRYAHTRLQDHAPGDQRTARPGPAKAHAGAAGATRHRDGCQHSPTRSQPARTNGAAYERHFDAL